MTTRSDQVISFVPLFTKTASQNNGTFLIAEIFRDLKGLAIGVRDACFQKYGNHPLFLIVLKSAGH